MNRNKNFIKKDILNQLIKKSDMVVHSAERCTSTFITIHTVETYPLHESFTFHLSLNITGKGLVVFIGMGLFERYSKIMSFPLNLIEESILELFHGVKLKLVHNDQGILRNGSYMFDQRREDPYNYIKRIDLSL